MKGQFLGLEEEAPAFCTIGTIAEAIGALATQKRHTVSVNAGGCLDLFQITAFP